MSYPHSQPVISSCLTCKHYKLWSNPPTCKAFPRQIPMEILEGKDLHTEPYRGDNGIQYEKED